MATNFQRTPGESEAALAPRSGLRRKDFTVHCLSNQTFNVATRTIGPAATTGTSTGTSATTMTDSGATWVVNAFVGATVTTNAKTGVVTSNTSTTLTVASWTGGTPASANSYSIAGANVTAWTSLTIANQQNPFCGTLVVQVVQSATTVVKTLRLRIRGFDQFGQYQEELTPTIVLAQKTNNFIYCAKLFSHITAVHYRSTQADPTTDTIAIGTRWDWTRTTDGTNEHQYGRNLGIPVPLRLGRRAEGVTSTRYRQRQPAGIGDLSVDPANAVGAFSGRAVDGYAKNNLSVLSVPVAAETVTIDSVVYTWRASVATTAREVLIGADATASAVNLAAAINAQGGSGTLYGSATTVHPTVRASSAGAVVSFIARTRGAIGNSIDVSETMTNGAFDSAALRGGIDSPTEVVAVVVQDVTGSGSSGAITNHSPQDYVVGWQVAGWSCPTEKIHFIRQSAVTQWAITDNIFVRMTVLSAETGAS